MLVSTTQQCLRRQVALVGASLIPRRAFGLTAPSLKEKKFAKHPFKFPGAPWNNFLAENMKGISLKAEGGPEALRETVAKWAQMSAEEKAKYGPGKEVLQEYYAKRREWKKENKNKPRPKPTRAPSGYSMFVKERYDRSLSFKENGPILAAAWRDMSESEKAPYKEKGLQAAVSP